MSDFGQPSVSTTHYPRARKSHRCCECPIPIAPGEVYELVKGCWDGEWSTYKTCWPCVDFRAIACPSEYEYGSLHEFEAFTPYLAAREVGV